MGHAVSKAAKVALPILGTVVGGPLGGAIGGAVGGAIGGGGLSGALRGGITGGIGGLIGPGLGATAENALGSTGAETLGGITGGAANALGSTIGGTTIGQAVGGFAGNSIGGSIANALIPQQQGGGQGGGNVQAAGPAAFHPSQQAAMQTPASLSSLGSLTPGQQSTNIANQGVYGGGQGPQEDAYFLNLINRRLVDQGGHVAPNLSGVNPIENSFLAHLGLGGQSNPTNLLQAISKWQAP